MRHVREAAIHSLERGYTMYTSNHGLIELRRAIARHLERLYGVQYSSDLIAPALQLCTEHGIAPDHVSELWLAVDRHDASLASASALWRSRSTVSTRRSSRQTHQATKPKSSGPTKTKTR